ncbi:MAG: hypothetical protein ACOH1K_07490, partial [Rhodoglobus sp.]
MASHIKETEFTMKGKILLVVGLGIGYVLGTRAGRARYEQIKATASKLWNDPRIEKQRHNAEDFVKDKAPDVAEFLADSAKKVVKQVATGSSRNRTVAAKSSSARAARKVAGSGSTTTKSTASKSAAAKSAASNSSGAKSTGTKS